MRVEDWRHERRINQAKRCMVAATCDDQKRAAWERMKALIQQRSLNQVARMESKAGLR